MKITNPNQVVPDSEIFLARVIIDNNVLRCGIHKLKVVQCPADNDPSQIIVEYGTFQSNGNLYYAIDMINAVWELLHAPAHPTAGFNLQMDDMGIIPNTHNMHQTFDNLIEAKQYACTVLGISDTNNLHEDYNRAMKVI